MDNLVEQAVLPTNRSVVRGEAIRLVLHSSNCFLARSPPKVP